MFEEKSIEYCKKCLRKGLQNKILKFATIQDKKNTSLFFCSSRKVKLRK